MAVLVLAVLGGFAMGIPVGTMGLLAWRSAKRSKLMEAYVVSPSSKSIRREWVPSPEGRMLEVPRLDPDEDEDETALVALDGGFVLNGEAGPAVLVDADSWKLLDPQEERMDVPQLYPIDGNHLRAIIRDERVEEWQTHQSSALERLPDLLVKATLGLGLLMVVVIVMLVSGFDMMG